MERARPWTCRPRKDRADASRTGSPRPAEEKRGVLAEYAKQVKSASKAPSPTATEVFLSGNERADASAVPRLFVASASAKGEYQGIVASSFDLYRRQLLNFPNSASRSTSAARPPPGLRREDGSGRRQGVRRHGRAGEKAPSPIRTRSAWSAITWLRAPELAPDAKIAADVKATVDAIAGFAAQVHGGQVKGTAGKFTDLLCIGIGGSALGPQSSWPTRWAPRPTSSASTSSTTPTPTASTASSTRSAAAARHDARGRDLEVRRHAGAP
jgi:hypothetical protein